MCRERNSSRAPQSISDSGGWCPYMTSPVTRKAPTVTAPTTRCAVRRVRLHAANIASGERAARIARPARASPRSRPPRGRLAGVARRTPLLAGTPLDEADGRYAAVQGRMPAAHRLVQVPRRVQPAGPARRRRAPHRRRRLLLRQPRPGRRRGGADARHPGDDRDARGRAGHQARQHARARRRGRALRPRSPRTAKASPRKLVAERGATLVPAYDDPHVVAGQGTAGLELMQQAAELGLTPDQVLVPTSGGGTHCGHARSQFAPWRRRPRCTAWSRRPSTTRAARSRPARCSRIRRMRARSATPCSPRRRAG